MHMISSSNSQSVLQLLSQLEETLHYLRYALEKRDADQFIIHKKKSIAIHAQIQNLLMSS